MACFRNGKEDEAFSVALVLYLDSEGSPEKVYCFSQGEKSIAKDCAGLKSTERVRQQMEQRGFRATVKFNEYHSWFAKATAVRSKAMDMLNQTVAVKDIQSLNRFIRDHMLEAKPWGEKVDSLLNHFTQLSEAHQSLLRVQHQAELLAPLAGVAANYRQSAERLEKTRRIADAADSFFSTKVVDLFTSECAAKRSELTLAESTKQRLSDQIAAVQEERRKLKNEIEECGGQRLREIPLLIANHQTEARAKSERSRRFHDALRQAGLTGPVTDVVQFTAVSQQLSTQLAQLRQDLAASETQRVDLAIRHRHLTTAVQDDERASYCR